MRPICLIPLAITSFLLYGTGSFASAYKQTNENGMRRLIAWETRQLSDTFFSEGATVGDIDRDGHVDVISGPFWYAGPDFVKQHPFAPPKGFDPHGYSDNFFAFVDDLDGDGWLDILVLGFPGKDAAWFENPQGKERFWERHSILDIVDNESPTYTDLTGDGKREIVCSRDGYFGYASPHTDDPRLPWKFRAISDQSAGGRYTHGLGVGDVNDDGRLDLLEKSGWWEQPGELNDGRIWQKHSVVFSAAGGAQMFAYDFDGDGDQDVLTSRAAHGYGLVWYEQTVGKDGPQFEPHLIIGETPDENPYGVCFSQIHAVELADIDGDGVRDIVTGKRFWAHGPTKDLDPTAAAVVYWFRTVRSDDAGEAKSTAVSFVPHLIHNNSGIGVEVKARDLNGDGHLDVVVGNKAGTFVHFQRRQVVTAENWQRAQPVPDSAAARPLQRGIARYDGLPPEEAAQAMTVPEGFQVELAAGEPQIHQPIALTIDERGRLWIAEAHTYPVRAPEGEGRDNIVILEDRDKDGRFETRKEFITGLNLVSGLEVGFGGVWVGAAPYFLFIPDRDGDDRPDSEPEILLDGWGYQDTHETLNAFNWGPDGWLYGCQGVFTHSKIGKPGTPDNERIPLNACVWRYHPVRHDFEIFAWGSSNPWGVDFNDHGQAFISACVIPHLYHVIQGARYHRQAGKHFDPYIFGDIPTIAEHLHYTGSIRDHAWWGRDKPVDNLDTDKAGGGHAHCGAMIYLGDNWPTAYRNQIFMNNIHGNRVNMDRLERRGSGYVGKRGADFLFSNDRWYRGINLRYGPDGGVYLIDWYDPNACHRRTPETWDRTNGRAYKVTYGKTKPVDVNLSAMADGDLVELHERQNDWYVRIARRILQHRAAEKTLSAEAIAELRRRLTESTDITRELRYLWTLHAVGGLDEGLAIELLSHPSEYIRGWTVQLLAEPSAVSPRVLAAFNELSRSERTPFVRLYLASALQRLPVDQRWDIAEALASQGDDALDHNLPYLIWYGVKDLVPTDPRRALRLASTSRIPLVTEYIYRRAAAEPETLKALLVALGGEANLLRQKLMLNELVAALRTRANVDMPSDWPAVYAKLSEHTDAEIRQQAQFVTVKFGDKSIFPALREIVADQKSEQSSRVLALQTLVTGKDTELPPLLLALLDDVQLRTAALQGLASYQVRETPAAIVSRYSSWSDAEKQTAVNTLASRIEYAHALLDAIATEKIPRSDVSAFTADQLLRFENKDLIAKVGRVWGTVRTTPEEKLKLIAGLQKQLSPKVLAEADRSHGRQMFNKMCGKCHRLFGEGGKVGPEITGANRGNLNYLLQNVIDPNAVVGRDYQSTVIVTADGRVVTGLLRDENDTAVVLQTVEQEVVIPKADIEVRKRQETSIMPEDQLKPLQHAEIRDLIAYLQSPTQVPLPGESPLLDEKTGRMVGVIEGESLKPVEKPAGSVRPQAMQSFSKGRWSGNSQLWWTGGKPGDRLVLEFPVDSAGRYHLSAALTKAHDYAIVQLEIDGQPLAGPIDLYNRPDVVSTGSMSLGTLPLTAGTHRLGVSIVGRHPEATPAFMFGMDYLYVTRTLDEPATEK